MEQQRVYLAIDLKSFYASVECVDRGLDPLSTNLVVADASRTEKTICLAVSPSLKAYRIPGRARLFEVVQRTKEVNAQRLQAAIRQRRAVRRENGSYDFLASSSDAARLNADPSLRLDYIVAPPRMARYLQVSEQINKIYLRYVAPEDIHPYSIDEVFMDVTSYLPLYKLTAHELAMKLAREVLSETGITATAGIGGNLYLCKVAMDIVAKHIPPDSNGVRIAMLDAQSYRQQLWSYRPITDFWRVGPGYAKKLAQYGMYTMGDVARCSTGASSDFYNEDNPVGGHSGFYARGADSHNVHDELAIGALLAHSRADSRVCRQAVRQGARTQIYAHVAALRVDLFDARRPDTERASYKSVHERAKDGQTLQRLLR